MSKPLTWTTGKARLCDLEEYDKNPVQISERELTELAKSLKKFGHIIPYTAAAPKNGTHVPILDGHQRKRAEIEKLGIDPKSAVEVRYPSRKLTERERQEIIIRLRKNTGQFDGGKLLDFFQADDLLEWGFDEKELTGFGFEFENDTQDAEPQIDRANELLKKWKVKAGDLWQIGKHRLICGDSTKADDYKTLMKGETASMCFTSPPYNQGGKAFRLPAFYKGEGDNKTKDEYFDFLISVLECLNENMTPDAPLLWNVSYNSQSRDDYGRIIFSTSNPFHVMETIIWDKKHGFNVSARGILSRDSELIFLMCSGEDYYTNQGRYDTWYNTWRIGTIGAQTEGHGAAYPLELVEKGVTSFSPEGAIILEPFCGTGTNIVACQNLGRRCRAIEISPSYVAVALQRMSDAFPDLEIKRLK